MAISLDQFAGHLVDSGVLSGEEVSVCRAASSARDTEQFARELVKQKKLTAYQAQQLYSGKGKGLVLGNYVVLDKLGQGGMGMVLKARHRRMDRLVALKVLSPTVVKTPDLLARFHREVKAAARLEHPNIVAAYDADEARGTHFFVMQYVEGNDLASVVKKKGPLPVDQAINCLLQAARGLDYAHNHGVIHRDIKPANLLLDNQGTVKVLDMGLARIEGETGSQAELTSTGAVMGTVDYMAPEQALSTKSADAKSDIYSLGITLWYLLVARPAYEGDSLMARLLAHRESPIPSLKGARAEVPEALDALFRRMVAKSPKDRWQSMSEVVAALDTCLKGDIGGAGKAPSIAGGPTEDSKLSNFLGLFGGGTDPMAVTAATPKSKSTAAVGAPTPGSEYEATITSAASAEGTDPATLTNLARSTQQPLRTRRPFSWRRPRTIAAATGVCVFLLGAVLLWPGRKPVPPVPPSPAPAGVAQVDPAGPGPAQDGDSPEADSPEDLALRFDGDDIVQLADAGLDSEEPFTVEAWVRSERFATMNIILSIRGLVTLQSNILGEHPHWIMYCKHADDTSAYATESPSITDLPGRAVHLAAVFDGVELRFYVDGKLQKGLRKIDAKLATVSDGESKIALTRRRVASVLGAYDSPQRDPPVQSGFEGTLNEIRISRVARYRDEFQPSLKRFKPDDKTAALYHCDEGTGEVLVDSSGNGHNGKILGAAWVRRTTPIVDLLALIDPAKHAVKGAWEKASDGLRSDKTLAATIQIPYQPPAEYDLRLSFTRREGIGVIAPILVGGDRQFQFDYAGWFGDIYGFGKIDGKNTNDNPTTVRRPPLENGKRYTALIQVRREGARAWLDGEFLTELKTDYRNVAPDDHVKLPDASALGLVTNGAWSIHTLTLEPVAEKSVSLDGAPAGPTRDAAPPMTVASADNALLIDSTTLGITILPQMKYDGTHPLTIEAWVKPATIDAAHLPNNYGGHAIMHPFLDVRFNVKDRRWMLFSSTDKTKVFTSKQTAAHVEKEDLTHIAGVLADGKLKLFLDGKLQFTEELDGPLPADFVNNTFFIGDGPEAGGRRFLGIIDEVRFSRIARYNGDFPPQRRFVPDSDTLALYHFDEEEGAAVADSSPRNRPLWMVGRAEVRMPKRVRADGTPIPRSPDGRFALDFDGEKDFVETPDVPLDLARPYTVEAWVMPTQKRGGGISFLRRGPRVSAMWRGAGYDAWIMLGSFEAPGEPTIVEDGASNALDFGAPQHVALVCDPVARTTRVYVNGVTMSGPRKFSGTKAESFVDSGSLVIGKLPDVAGDREVFQGRLYGYRLSQGTKYDTNFTPTWELPAEQDTLVLYRCGEGSGEVLKDLSGNNRQGKITGCVWVNVDDRPSMMVPLHSLVQVPRHTVKGTWTFDGRDLMSDASLMSTVLIPYHPPAEYDIELEFTRRAETGVLAPMLTKGDRRFHYEFGGWGGTFFGFGLVDGKKVKDSPTALVRDPLENGRRYTGRIQIRNGVARAWLDGELLSELKTDYSNLALETAVELPDPLALGLSTTSEFSIHSAKLWPIGPATEAFDREHPVPAKDYAFDYPGKNGGVEAKTLKWDGTLPLTFEARVHPTQNHPYPNIIARLRGKGACQFQWEPGHWVANISDHTASTTWVPRAPMRAKTGPWDIAYVIDRDKIRIFENGTMVLDHAGWTHQFTHQFEPQLCLGGYSENGTWSDYNHHGTIDEIRLSKVARYKEDYVPQRRLTVDADTLALYHFDEGAGNIAHDASGNGHDGTIFNRTWTLAAPPASTAKVGPDGAIDPLAGLDVNGWNYRPDMTWKRKGGIVVGTGSGTEAKTDWIGTGFPIGIDGDYQVEIDLKQRGSYPMQIDFPLRDRAIRIHLAPDDSGLMQIEGKDGLDIGPPDRRNAVKLESDKLHKFVGRVRFKGDDVSVEVTLDGRLVSKFEGARSRVSLPHWVKPDLKDVKITAHADLRGLVIELHRVRVRPLPAEPAR